MKTGAFLCSCADTCDVDLEAAREGVADVDVSASSSLLCGEKIGAFESVIDEYELDEVTVTCPETAAQEKLRAVAEESGVAGSNVEFVDQREAAGWVHDEAGATVKTARMLNARRARREAESMGSSSIHRAGYDVVVVGDPKAAETLSPAADVTLIADGEELADVDADLEGVDVERGRVTAVEGTYGEFEVVLEATVTKDCISCMKCVEAGPDGMVTRYPVDIDPAAPDGGWTDVCPTGAIDMDGVTHTLPADQVVYPAGDSGTIGGQRGFHTGPVDGATVEAVESLLGGFEGPDHLELDMSVCAAGDGGAQGCNECVEACPHDAVERASIDEVEFHLDSCQDCGACTSACPTGATQLHEPSNEMLAREVEALVDPVLDDPGLVEGLLGGSKPELGETVVAFVCSERAQRTLTEYGRMAAAGDDSIEYPPILPLNVNCTDTVGEAHVMHALAAGADGVAIVGCGGSCLHSGPDPKAELVDRLNTATTDLGLGERVAFFAPEPEAPGAFVEEVSQFVDHTLDETPIPAGAHEATGGIDDPDRPNPPFDSHGWTLESVRAILEHVEPERDEVRGLKDFGIVEVAEGCTLTPTCANYCPTDALRRTDTGLDFNHERCVNCGLCEDVCVEDVLSVETGLDLSRLPENREGDEPEWEQLYEGQMQSCAGCGRKYASEATVDAIEERVGDKVADMAPTEDHGIFDYCPECRAEMMHGNTVGGRAKHDSE
ncbi:4Fe-4S binding protein [Halorubrum gandharaense]